MDARYRPNQPTLCWECKNTNRYDCPWFDPSDPQPVPGWVAEPREMYSGSTTYLVRECPKFEPEPPREIATPRPGEPVPGVQRKKTPNGVYWVANIMHGRKNYYLGCFPSKEEAIAARLAAEATIARSEEPKRKEPQRKEPPAEKRSEKKPNDKRAVRGVRRGERHWTAHIRHDGKVYHLGYFKTEEKAIAARLAAEEAIKRGETPAH